MRTSSIATIRPALCPRRRGGWADDIRRVAVHHERPPVEMLLRVKRFAEACKLNGEGPLPPPVAAVLYFASIVAARLRCDRRISELVDDVFTKGMEGAQAQAWVDPATRSIFDEAVAKWAAT